jgi:1-acyl-sn-glycerol-3-phosphate acyltransferase
MTFLWIMLALFVLVVAALMGGRAYGAKWSPSLSAVDGLLYLFGFAYARGVHDLQVEFEEGAKDDLSGPMIVVCNHTAGVDPILVSLSVPTKIRWMMAEDMRLRGMNWFWNWVGVIFVARNRHGRTGLRQARKHLSEGGVIGIFPEGRIERPARKLLPFAPGVGVLVQRSGARVLPVIIEGTPTHAKSAWDSLWMRSATRVRVMRPIDYKDSGKGNAEIAKDLHERFERWTGWASKGPALKPEADAGELLAFDENGVRRQIA